MHREKESPRNLFPMELNLEERLRTMRNGGVEIHHPVFGKHEGKFRLRAKVAHEMM
jgi:hypothetical protein